MNLQQVRALLLVLLCSGVEAAMGQDADRGALLYENHCIGCHESVVHIRSDRKVHDLEGLHRQVRRWSDAQGLGWTPEEVGAVAHYLDRRYYRLGAVD